MKFVIFAPSPKSKIRKNRLAIRPFKKSRPPKIQTLNLSLLTINNNHQLYLVFDIRTSFNFTSLARIIYNIKMTITHRFRNIKTTSLVVCCSNGRKGHVR